MSSTYLVGEQTKRKIFRESKKLFYKKGFAETTYDDISTAAKVNRALIPYYFKNKQILGQKVYSKIMEDFTEAFNKTIDVEHYPPDVVHILQTFAYYHLLNNEKYARFAIQVQSDESFSTQMVKSEKNFITGFGSKASKFSENELNIIAKMDFGIEKEIVRMVYFAESSIDIDQIVKVEIHMIMGYTGYSKKKIDELIDSALDIMRHLSIRVKNGFSIEINTKEDL